MSERFVGRRIAILCAPFVWSGCFLVANGVCAQSLEPERVNTVVEALTRLGPEKVRANPKLKEALEQVLDATQGTPQFVELVRDFGVKNRQAALLQIAITNSNNSTGADAARLLLENQAFDRLKSSLASTNAVQTAEVLGHTGDHRVVPFLEPLVTETNRDVTARKQAVRSLARIQEGAALLLRLAREGKLPDDSRLLASTELNAVRWTDLKAEAGRVLPPPQGREAGPLPPVSDLARMSGSATRGSEVFRRDMIACIKCHQVKGEGADVGPNLSEIGTKLGNDALYESILDPSAGIAFGYEAWQIELNSGDEAFGLIVSETADEIAVKAQTGIVSKYRKSDITRRTQQKLSLMPVGLQQAMSTQDLVDLVEYLSSLKKAMP